jgi:ubiquinone/menaquinone biosynthesis C-methylase UbiE
LAGAGAGEVVGVDLDPVGYVAPAERERMLERLAGPRSANVRLEQGDVHALALADGSFDLVVSATAVKHFSNLRTALGELHRVLRRGSAPTSAWTPSPPSTAPSSRRV